MAALEEFFGVSGAYLRGEVSGSTAQQDIQDGIQLNGIVRENVYQEIERRLDKFPSADRREFLAVLNNVHLAMLRLLPGGQLRLTLNQFDELTTAFTYLSTSGRAKLSERVAELRILDKSPHATGDFQPEVLQLRVSVQPASAGAGVYLGPEAMEEQDIPANDITRRAAYGVPVSGDSMEPLYHDGDLLLVSLDPVEIGDIAVVIMDGNGYVKRIGDGQLISLNKKYAPIPMDESIKISGKVIGSLPQSEQQ